MKKPAATTTAEAVTAIRTAGMAPIEKFAQTKAADDEKEFSSLVALLLDRGVAPDPEVPREAEQCMVTEDVSRTSRRSLTSVWGSGGISTPRGRSKSSETRTHSGRATRQRMQEPQRG